MRHEKGDLFTSKSVALGHGVNIHGLMGAGIAKGFKEKYQDNYLAYSNLCRVNGLHAGETFIYAAKESDLRSRAIVNMASQDQPGANATYEWLLSSALSAAKQLKSIGVNECAIPEIGSGIGGLVWHKAQAVLEAVEIVVGDFEWEVWHYDPTV